MKIARLLLIGLSVFADRALKAQAAAPDRAHHTVSMVTVDASVKLEVLDWGGTGRPMVLLAGLGNDAHVFDSFAPKLTAKYHVYGITRRGFGASSVPAPAPANYNPDRLGDDVLAAIDALKLERPILVGHSIAGEELSSIGSRHPEKVAALVYLDAAYAYAFYDQAQGDTIVDAVDLKRKLDRLLPGSGADPKPATEALLADLPRFERDLDRQRKAYALRPDPPQPYGTTFGPAQAIIASESKYGAISKLPILAIYAEPHEMTEQAKGNASVRTALMANDAETTGAQSRAFEAAMPNAHVVRLPNANHYLFESNEKDVLREMDDFLGKLAR